jgi:NADH-quinone oxidoreductase subunit D
VTDELIDADLQEALAREEMELRFGPRHPSIQGVLRLKVDVEGERIVDLHPILGDLHAGLEKDFENHSLDQNVSHTDRLDLMAPTAGNLAYVGAVEKLIGIALPPRARYIRTLLAELQRIGSHLHWLGAHAMDIGAEQPFLLTLRERDLILGLFKEVRGCLRPGGLSRDLPEGWADRCRAFGEAFPSKADECEGLLTENRLWKKRTVGVGVLDPQVAVDSGVTGPMLRASGIAWDVRKAMPYEAYGEVEFDVPVGKNGDTYDRYLVRIAEMRQAGRIIAQCLETLPAGPVLAEHSTTPQPAKDAEVYHGIEGPKGEIGFYIQGDGTANPYRCRVRAPSFFHLGALPEICKEQSLADLLALIGTLDIGLGEVER